MDDELKKRLEELNVSHINFFKGKNYDEVERYKELPDKFFLQSALEYDQHEISGKYGYDCRCLFVDAIEKDVIVYFRKNEIKIKRNDYSSFCVAIDLIKIMNYDDFKEVNEYQNKRNFSDVTIDEVFKYLDTVKYHFEEFIEEYKDKFIDILEDVDIK